MPRMFVTVIAIAAAIPLRSVPAQQTERVDLAGLASIELPSSFKPVGRGQDGPRLGHFDPATLDRHRNDYQITFRFEQAQRAIPGGRLANPVLLHVTLFSPGKPKRAPPPRTRGGATACRAAGGNWIGSSRVVRPRPHCNSHIACAVGDAHRIIWRNPAASTSVPACDPESVGNGPLRLGFGLRCDCAVYQHL